MHLIDLERSSFYKDVFWWDNLYKRKNDHLGHFVRSRRVKQLIDTNRSYLDS